MLAFTVLQQSFFFARTAICVVWVPRIPLLVQRRDVLKSGEDTVRLPFKKALPAHVPTGDMTMAVALCNRHQGDGHTDTTQQQTTTCVVSPRRRNNLRNNFPALYAFYFYFFQAYIVLISRALLHSHHRFPPAPPISPLVTDSVRSSKESLSWFASFFFSLCSCVLFFKSHIGVKSCYLSSLTDLA